MFDFHMHTAVSFDGKETGLQMAAAAKEKGLKEICFTDHMDYEPGAKEQTMLFTRERYCQMYDGLQIDGLKIRRGMEFGMLPGNQAEFKESLQLYPFDFVLGSVHFAEGLDVYYAPYWAGKTVWEAEHRYLEQTLQCVSEHDDFDVLAHLNFISKARAHPAHTNLRYDDHRELVDEILKTLVRKGKGLEMNTSGVDRCGGYLPTADFFLRFRQLGGQIVTVGSDAHNSARVGQYCSDACRILSDIFGYVCTFEERKPIFHKL